MLLPTRRGQSGSDLGFASYGVEMNLCLQENYGSDLGFGLCLVTGFNLCCICRITEVPKIETAFQVDATTSIP
ncbi:hypothetical protein L2E82_48915 [Cichorium intybus]|uniref:Uncharacterized protein n=1 Tax=Cichorium intybus TaxID=13427 RepID=A0ACB8YZ03_CICIN|nr:hypothetical protein L2E82_48915 [Cichorium intybus]